MRNPDLPKLLRAIGNSEHGQTGGRHVIYEQAAIELEKLEKIYQLAEDIHDTDGRLLGRLQKVLKDG